MSEFHLQFDSARFIADPYPAYRRLREVAPVHRSPEGVWYLTRHRDAFSLLTDSRFSRNSPGASPLRGTPSPRGAMEELISRWMVFRDGPDHVRARRELSGAFRPRAIDGMRGRIQELVDGLIDGAAKRGGMDVVSDLAYPLPMMVIAGLLDLPLEDGDRFRQWSNQITQAVDRGDAQDMENAAPAALEMCGYFRALLQQGRGGALSPFLSGGGAEPAQEDALATIVFLMWAGHETTKNLIASGLLTLLRNPGELERLRRAPELIDGAVEECLRYESPLQKIGRWSLEDVRIGDCEIPRGAFVVALIGAANRDPAQFPDPERFDIGRADGSHIAFGAGPHHCLGGQLARLEARIALSTVVRRLPRLGLSPGAPAWRPYTAFRSLESLRVTF